MELDSAKEERLLGMIERLGRTRVPARLRHALRQAMVRIPKGPGGDVIALTRYGGLHGSDSRKGPGGDVRAPTRHGGLYGSDS